MDEDFTENEKEQLQYWGREQGPWFCAFYCLPMWMSGLSCAEGRLQTEARGSKGSNSLPPHVQTFHPKKKSLLEHTLPRSRVGGDGMMDRFVGHFVI